MRCIGLLLLALPAWACQCASWPTAREAFSDSPLVFAGRVERVTMSTVNERAQSYPIQLVSVRVEEPFKGVELRQEVALRQPADSCSASFKVGDHYLFYLHPADQPGTWRADGCHRSTRVDYAADDFLFLRAMPKSLEKTRLSGEINLYEQSPSEGFRRQRPLAGIRVKIAGEHGIKEAFTNGDGVYEVYGLPAGKYKIDIDVPQHLKIDFPMNIGRKQRAYKRGEIELDENGSAAVSFVLMVDNQMSGRVFDPSGNPMNDVCVNLESSHTSSSPHFLSGCTKDGGRFTLTEMPPGQYRLVINPDGRQTSHEPFGTLYYPGTSDRSKATVVTISEGEHIDNLDIRVPGLSRRIKVSGRMQFQDGTPIPGQFVDFAASSSSYVEHASTARDGSFAITVLAGVPGQIQGEIWVDQDSAAKCPALQAKFNQGAFIAKIAALPVVVSGKDDQPGVVLTVPVPFCRDWRNYGLRDSSGK
jgi:hypothetical protein